jgi:translation initiation factor IF-2
MRPTMRRALTYSLLFAGVFVATVWIRLAQRDAPAPAAAERADTGDTRAPAAAPAPVTAPSAPEVAPAAGASADEDPRDAIAGDEYPVSERYGAQATPPAPGPRAGGAPELRPAPPAPPRFDPAADAQRDEIAGDVYPKAPGNAAPGNVP